MSNGDIEIVPLLKQSVGALMEEPGFIVLMLLPYIVVPVMVLHAITVLGSLSMTSIIPYFESAFSGNLHSMMQGFTIIVIWALVYLAAFFALGVVSVGSMISKAGARKSGKKLSISQAIVDGFKIFPQLFGTHIVAILVMLGPIFALIPLGIFVSPLFFLGFLWFIPMIYLALRFFFYQQACVLDDLGPIDSLKKSWQASKGNLALILASFLLIFFISTIASLIFSRIGGIIHPILNVMGSMISGIIIGPISIIFITFVYLKIKERESL